MVAILKHDSKWSWPKNLVENCIKYLCISNMIKISTKLWVLFYLNLKFFIVPYFETRWQMQLTNKHSWDLYQACLLTKYHWNLFIIMGTILFKFIIFKWLSSWNKMAHEADQQIQLRSASDLFTYRNWQNWNWPKWQISFFVVIIVREKRKVQKKSKIFRYN